MAETYRGIIHPFASVWNHASRALVLGTFPSVQSRENAFYYGHPQNRFWRVLAALFAEEIPENVPEKQALLLHHGVALWDVLAACDITGSADGSIRRPEPNDIRPLLNGAPIGRVFANGQTAAALYRRWCEPVCGVPVLALPSTSPANARWTLEALTEAWQPLRECVSPPENR
ncbi:MAG: DNA-deoxyinosine glycosylase [Eubacteriales bacterium]|nr:DNA-deoxyinosine glycosylase [Eubacteriales bacterium]